MAALATGKGISRLGKSENPLGSSLKNPLNQLKFGQNQDNNKENKSKTEQLEDFARKQVAQQGTKAVVSLAGAPGPIASIAGKAAGKIAETKAAKWGFRGLIIAGLLGVVIQISLILVPIALAVYVVLFFTGST